MKEKYFFYFVIIFHLEFPLHALQFTTKFKTENSIYYYIYYRIYIRIFSMLYFFKKIFFEEIKYSHIYIQNHIGKYIKIMRHIKLQIDFYSELSCKM